MSTDDNELENEDFLPYIYQESEKLRKLVKFQNEMIQNLHLALLELTRGVEIFYKLMLLQFLAVALVLLVSLGWAVLSVLGAVVGVGIWGCLVAALSWKRKRAK